MTVGLSESGTYCHICAAAAAAGDNMNRLSVEMECSEEGDNEDSKNCGFATS